MEMVNKIIMMRESPKHSRLIHEHQLEYQSLWDNGNIKYRVFKNAAGHIHKIGSPAMFGWDQEGTKVLEMWFKNGVVSRSGLDEPARTIWDKGGNVYNKACFDHGQLGVSTSTPSNEQVWSMDFEKWVDEIWGIDDTDERAIVETASGRFLDVPHSCLEHVS